MLRRESGGGFIHRTAANIAITASIARSARDRAFDYLSCQQQSHPRKTAAAAAHGSEDNRRPRRVGRSQEVVDGRLTYRCTPIACNDRFSFLQEQIGDLHAAVQTWSRRDDLGRGGDTHYRQQNQSLRHCIRNTIAEPHICRATWSAPARYSESRVIESERRCKA